MRQWEFFCSMMTGQDGYLSYLSDLCKFPAYHAKHVTTSPDPFGQEATGKATPFVQHAVTFPANSWLQRLRLPNNLYKYLFLLPISICSTPPRELTKVWNLKPPDHDDLLPGIGESRGSEGYGFQFNSGTCSALLNWFLICILVHLLWHVPQNKKPIMY